MPYIKQTWKNGDVITEDKLNHMEDGIASGGMFIVGSTYDESTQTGTLDKTYKEIVDAFNAGQNVILKNIDGSSTNISLLSSYIGENNMFVVSFYDLIGKINVIYSTDSENGYPSLGGGGSD